MFKFEEKTFTWIRGSDINPRDGMYLELREVDQAQGLAEVFYSDETNQFALNTFENSIPLPVVEWLIEQARLMLPSTD